MALSTTPIFQVLRDQYLHLLFTLLTLALLTPTPSSWACGSIGDWIALHNPGAPHQGLVQMLDCADSYKAPIDDVILLPFIQDALKGNSQLAAVAKQVFTYYNHLWGARHESAYPGVFKAVTGRDDWKSLTKYREWMVVTAASGANMREGPSLDSPVIVAIKYGMQVKAVARQGDWVKAQPVGPGAVDPRFERRMGYIHESLLMAY